MNDHPTAPSRPAKRLIPLVLLLAPMVAPLWAQPLESNWVRNGSFAVDLQHWSTEGTVSWDGIGSPAGGSMRLQRQPSDPGSTRAWQCLPAPLPSSSPFRLSAQVLGSFFTHRVEARAYSLDACQGTALGSVSAPIVATGADGWSRVELGPFDFPGATQSIEIALGVQSGTIWVDSVEFGAVRDYVTVSGGPADDRHVSVAIPWAQPDTAVAVFHRLGGPLSAALYGTRSEDRGETWGAAAEILDTPEHERSPTLVQTGASSWSLFHHRLSEGRIYRQTSGDGIAFSPPSPVDLGSVLPIRFKDPHVVRGSDGALTMVYNAGGSGLGGSQYREAYVARSLDGGDSWDASMTLAASDTLGLREPRIAQRLADGVWMLAYVTGQIPVVGPAAPGTVWIKQTANPYDWSAPARRLTPEDGVDNVNPSPVVLADGSFVVVWSRLVDGAYQVFGSRSLDGVTWQAPVQLTSRLGLHNIDPLALAGAQPGTIDLYWSAGQVPGNTDFDIALRPAIDMVDFLFIDGFESP